MKEEKKIVESVQPTATATVSAETKAETPVRKFAFFGDQNDAIRAAIRDGKSFELARMLKTIPAKRPGDKPLHYYDYVVCLILKGVVPFKFLHFKPYSDYIARDAISMKAKQNSVSYAQLNFMYDLGGGLNLVLREDKSDDSNRKDPKWRFFAVATDEDGVSAEFELVPNTAGDRQFVLSAFSGFGKCRSFTFDDVNADKPKGIKDAFKNYLGPGEDPGVEVSDNVE
jgi:hypothetical protein